MALEESERVEVGLLVQDSVAHEVHWENEAD